MERGHLIRTAALVALTLGLASSAGAAGTWRVLADGASQGPGVAKTTGYLALDRAAAGKFSARIPAAGVSKLAHVDYAANAVVAIFGEFGCKDGRVTVTSVAQHGTTLAVRLVEKPPAPGTVECMAIFGTYRLLAVPRQLLERPYPTRVAVSGA